MCAAAQVQIQPIHDEAPPQNPATQHAPDGGTRTTIQSIDIPPLEGAPFVAQVDTEWSHLLADGTWATIKNHRLVARDTAGRIFQERRAFTPTGDVQQTRITELDYEDPVRQLLTVCEPLRRTCHEQDYQRRPITAMPAGTTGLKICGCASAPGGGINIQEDVLGQQTIESLNAIGSREITTLPAEMFGNKTPQPVVKEFWYSPQLGINLVTRRFDPRSGAENFVVSQVSLAQPDPKLFEPPADYAIIREMVVKPATPLPGKQ